MSDFSDFVQAELAERVSTETIAATGSLLVKADNLFSRDYDQLSQGTSGQILISAGTGALPVWANTSSTIEALYLSLNSEATNVTNGTFDFTTTGKGTFGTNAIATLGDDSNDIAVTGSRNGFVGTLGDNDTGASGWFDKGVFNAQLATAFLAGYFYDGTRAVTLCDGTNAATIGTLLFNTGAITTSSGDLSITAAGGNINFGDDNITTTGSGTFGSAVQAVLGNGDRAVDFSTAGFSGYIADDSEGKGFYLTDGTTTVEFVVTTGAAVFTGMSGFVSVAGSTLLHVSGPSGDAKIQLQRSNIITTGGQNFGEIECTNSAGLVLASLGFDSATSSNVEARFFISVSNNADALTINEDGYVGIAGDSSPNFASTILYIRDTSNPPVVTVQCATNNATGCKLRLTETTLFQGGYIHYNGSTNVLDIGMHNTNNTSLGSDLPMLRFNRDGDDIIVLAGVNFNINDTAFLVIDKTSTSGIKIDTTSPTFGFADLLGEVFARNTGASKPTRAAWKGGTFGFQFAVDDNEEFEFHIPHDYVKGTPIFLHVHWGHNATTVTGGTITFGYEMTYAKGHGQSFFGDNAIGTIVSATATTTQYSHELSEAQVSTSGGSGTQIDTDDLEPDGVIKMTVNVNANNLTVSSGGAPDIFMHYIDIHYQTTGLIGTKDKAPDFYA